MSDVGVTPRVPSLARLKLLDVADGLFYSGGINQIGIDRIIAEAGVTKATFYKQFGSKDTLIVEYVQGRARHTRDALIALAALHGDAGTVLTAVVDGVVAWAAEPRFRGCPFLNAAAEFPDEQHPVRLAITRHREWYAVYIEELLRAAGHPQAGAAADEFLLLRDGAVTGAYAGDSIAAMSAFVRGTHRIIAEARTAA
jgi:AcrR family transcriptional regulator